MDTKDLIFALDIGTRTIIGIVGKQEEDTFNILAAEIQEHKNRSMLDGQVHNIEQVAAVAKDVKEKLEKKLNIKLDKVAIAAAGRVLKTKQVKVEQSIDIRKEIDRDLIKGLEMEGIQLAQMQLDEELSAEEKSPYYCVGYDIVSYYLNNYVISSLVGHKGKSIGADILATFLPHTVVDGLHSVMSRIDLEITSLTLEPIAAINVAIPKDLRLLNLALIDIGAGTSDIAITKNGSVVGYAMVPVAGDEITEMLCHHYLLDFNTAEKIKVSLSSSVEDIPFSDIMGIEHIKKAEEITALIKPTVEHLANVIVQKILEYNHKAPNAVFLVGGGSQIEGLAECIASRLNLPPERVAVRNRHFIQNRKVDDKALCGPEAITPIGIAVTAQIQKGQDFLSVTVNDKKIKLFNAGNLNVADALALTGFSPSDLIAKTGPPLYFKLNGEAKTLKGEYGDPAEIYVNHKRANLETMLVGGDDITVKPAQEGQPAHLSIREILEYYADPNCTIAVNGEIKTEDYMIRNGDMLETIAPEELEVNRNMDSDSGITSGTALDNKTAFESDEEIGAGDVKTPDVSQTSSHEEEPFAIVHQRPMPPNHITVIVNGEEVVIKGDKQQYIFVDVFNYIDFDLSNPQGLIVLKLNGRQAGFTDAISSGDEIDIYWETRSD